MNDLNEYRLMADGLVSDCCMAKVEIVGHITKFYRCANCGNSCNVETRYKVKIKNVEIEIKGESNGK